MKNARAANAWKIAVAAVSLASLLVVILVGAGVWWIIRVANSTKEADRSELRYKLLNSSAAPAPAMHSGRLSGAQAGPGVFKLALTNGVSVEIVAVTRNPLENQSWWKPDGTPMPHPPGERVVFHPAGVVRANDVCLHEHALLVRYDFPPTGQSARHQTRYTPTPEHLGTLEIQRDDLATQSAGELNRLGGKLTGATGGPNARGGIVVYADVVRFPPAHPTRRCSAPPRSGRGRSWPFSWADKRKSSSRACRFSIEEFALERTPCVRGEIRDIPLTPRDPPAGFRTPANQSSGEDATLTDPP